MSPNNPEQVDRGVINASPTKEFFIFMLVRDIDLVDAIADLVDNSLDGARRVSTDDDYANLWVRLEADGTHFRISDNCGGIPTDIARDYAFRFGRPKNMPSTPHSVGQFGVGMKRALFKLGKHFRIESTNTNSRFVVEQNVDKWLEEPDEWHFRFSDLAEDLEANSTIDQRGTNILVTELHKSIAEEFELENFQTRLINRLQAAHQRAIEQSLAISLNQIPLHVQPTQLLQSDQLRPAIYETEIANEESDRSSSPIKVKLYAGISESNPSDAGWSVFCNGRMVLRADQTLTTGWGEDQEATIPKYHNQFSRFRGYAFFDSDDASRLPWNTTKNGVAADSAVYRAIRLQMVTLMRPVIDFLNKLDNERESDEKPLQEAVEAASAVELARVEPRQVFNYPTLQYRRVAPTTQRIQYDKEIKDIECVKRALGVRTLKEVGERTFDYFVEMECND